MSDRLEGGCLCGEIRYEISGEPFVVYHCHCGMCRRSCSGAFVTWVGVAVDGSNTTRGATKTYTSSDDGRRDFCPVCGAQISFRFLSDPGNIYFTAATLDHADSVEPTCHGYTGDSVRWLHIDDDLPGHGGNPPVIDSMVKLGTS